MQEPVFISENFRVLRKYEALGDMEIIQATVQEGSIPAWMEVAFVTTFLGRNFTTFFSRPGQSQGLLYKQPQD